MEAVSDGDTTVDVFNVEASDDSERDVTSAEVAPDEVSEDEVSEVSVEEETSLDVSADEDSTEVLEVTWAEVVSADEDSRLEVTWLEVASAEEVEETTEEVAGSLDDATVDDSGLKETEAAFIVSPSVSFSNSSSASDSLALTSPSLASIAVHFPD